MFNAFKLFNRLGGMRVESSSTGMLDTREIIARSVRGSTDVGVVGTRTDDGALRILLWNYHDVADGFSQSTPVALRVNGLTAGHDVTAATITRIDESNANAFTVWRQQGEPQSPSPQQIATLHEAALLKPASLKSSSATADTVEFSLNLLGHSVALVEIPLKRR